MAVRILLVDDSGAGEEGGLFPRRDGEEGLKMAKASLQH